MSGCKLAKTPMDPNTKLGSIIQGEVVDRDRYERLVGKLIYLTHTRPDISFVVSVVSQFLNKPSKEHMEVVYRILRYLKNYPSKRLIFKKTLHRFIEIYTDVDWASSPVDRRLTSRYCSYKWGNFVTWHNKKQEVVAHSSVEAEFRALAH